MGETILDKDIREPLFDFLEESFGKIRIIEEKTMGRSRADIVMITPDSLWGIEIKSDADTYARLSRQVKDYDKYFDRNIVVVGTTHAMHIEEHVPDYWGIITVEEVDGHLDFYILRRPQGNPKCDLKKKLSILWRPELYELQMWADMPKYKEKSKDFVIEKILERIPDKINEAELNEKISELLFDRDYNTVQEQIREYRKGELQKAIEKETDPQKKLELMVEQASKARNFTKKKRRRRRR
ncbi:sce7726 family protein [Butyrivibrio sp. AE2032]|uniref:sce7726 family protein n=1 Tax=Butyrivibrio sp. AE2032 TaxID=1458463 RepID=UPI0005587CC2|nr:sce7726 family protein [Butyrivibrio sp. AE2032]